MDINEFLDRLVNDLNEVKDLLDFERHGALFSTNLDDCYDKVVAILEEIE